MVDLVIAPPPGAAGIAHPVHGVRPEDMREVAVGTTIATLKPDLPGPLICLLNGSPLSRLTPAERVIHAALVDAGEVTEAHRYLAEAARRASNWVDVTVQSGDVIVWIADLPGDSDALRGVLQVAVLVIAYWIGGPAGAAFAAIGSIAVNILLPPAMQRSPEEQAANPAYTTSLTGNEARLDQPIWRICGRDKVTPPFAAQPYYEYRDDDGDNLDNDQYFFAVYALGTGPVDIEQAFIGKTPLSHYQDVLQHNYLAPGVQPSVALCNVVTSSEVTNLELEGGRFVGGYAACQPERQAAAVGIDMACPFGLGKTGPLTVSWRVDVREVDDFGRAIASWRVLGTETRTANTNTPQRWSSKYFLSTPARVEIRLVRTDIKDLDPAARHSLQWAGLRAYLSEAAPLDADTSHYEVVMRASQQLSNASQRDFSVIAKAKVRTWNPVDGWTAPMFTRNPAWWLADLWTNPIWGEGLPDSRIDLLGLFNFSKRCEQRQDRFDYTFDSSMDTWSASQLIARAGRARCFRRYGVYTLARDEYVSLPVTAFTTRNTVPNSMVMSEKLPVRETPDGFIIEYVSNITWDIIRIECPCPGFTYTNEAHPRYDPTLPKMANPVVKRLDGIKGAKHAEREGVYEAASALWRTRTVRASTEMQGLLVSYMAPIRWMPEIVGYGQSGDVVRWNPGTKVLSLTEPVDFTQGDLYITLIRDDGSLMAPALVSPGPTEYDVRMFQVPDFDVITEDASRERPKYLLGPILTSDEQAKISAIRDGGKSEGDAQLFDIEAVIDDPRVHTADNYLLPVGGIEQDPVDGTETGGFESGDESGDGTTLVLVHLTDRELEDGSSVAGGGLALSVKFRNDGVLVIERQANDEPDTHEVVGEWTLFPIEPVDAARFEIMAVAIPGYDTQFSDSALNTWLNLGTHRRWAFGEVGGVSDRWRYQLTITIREVSSGVVQESRKFGFTIYYADIGGGGGGGAGGS